MNILSKSLMAMATILLMSNAMASERILLQDKKILDAEINRTTLRCSALGYGLSELKINLKGLDGWTLLDHSNRRFGEFNGEPCMTAGACKEFDFQEGGFDLDEILRNNSGTERVVVHRIVKESKSIITDHHKRERCQRTLIEELKTKAAGIDFFHQRAISEELDVKVCH